MKLTDLIRSYPADKQATVVVPMAHNEEVIGCVGHAIRRGVARFILVGEQDIAERIATEHGVTLGTTEFVEQPDEVEACNTCAKLVHEGRAQLMMKGLVQTSSFTRALLNKEYALLEPGALLSHVAVMEVPGYHKLLLMSDGGINIDPDVEAKAKIIKNALGVAKGLGIDRPKVALGSAVEKVTDKMQSTVDARDLVELAKKGEFGDAIVDGPFGLDAILDLGSAKIKGIDSPVCGDADILLVPQIESGNFFYKTLTKFCRAKVSGVVVGSKAPAVVTSRADSEECKFFSLCLAVKLVTA